ncbi:MAG: FkbM family methyltransferase [Thermoprotei archaeon]
MSFTSQKGDELIELRYGGLRLKVKKSEAFVYYATFVVGEYNKIRLRVDDVVIDAGANIGDYTVKAASVVKQGKVIAIEPNPYNIEILKQNLVLNKLGNVEVLNCALSSANGWGYLAGDTVSASILRGDENSLNVQTITIDDVLGKYCPPDRDVVLKMDIEGAEELVFSNPIFLERVRELSMELHGERVIKDILVILKKHNYVVEEFGTGQLLKNTLVSIIRHPASFISAERKTGKIGFRGFIKTLAGNNPVPSIGTKSFRLIYARKHQGWV